MKVLKFKKEGNRYWAKDQYYFVFTHRDGTGYMIDELGDKTGYEASHGFNMDIKTWPLPTWNWSLDEWEIVYE